MRGSPWTGGQCVLSTTVLIAYLVLKKSEVDI